MKEYNQCQKIKNKAKIPIGKLRLNIVLKQL